ncbi:hypothetical protein ACGFI9_01480 [Micromonospora sp. NPDC048930]|uniref:hypothetical protein n=1 Tax=Micromonospora sp. NPDC048930 TaxID=3364261 RepID=UPI00371939D8
MTFPVGPRRVVQGSPARSPLRRSLAAAAIAYWPMEDGDSATVAASAFAGHSPMSVAGTVSFGAIPVLVPGGDGVLGGNDGTRGSGPVADLAGGGSLAASVPGSVTAATVSGWSVAAMSIYDRATITGSFVIFEVDTPGGTYVRWRVIFDPVGLTVSVVAYNTAGASTTILPPFVPGIGFVTFSVWQSAPGTISVGWRYIIDYGYEQFTTVSGTLAGIARVGVNTTRATSTQPMLCGHLSVFTEYPPPPELYWNTAASHAAIDGWFGEAATARLARLCAEDGVALNIPAVDPADEVMMGVQPVGTPLDLYRQCEEADLGVLHELGFGLGYLPRARRYNQPTTLTLDMNAGQVAPPLEPTDDDFLLRNRVTVRRIDGSEATAEDATSIAANGRYEQAVDVNLADDTQLGDHAAWRVHLAAVNQWTPDELRWLAHHEACHAVVALALGCTVDWADLDAGPGYGGTQFASGDPHTDAVVSLAGWMGSGGHLRPQESTHDTQQAYELVGIAGFPAAMRDAAAILASRRSDIAAVAAALLEHEVLTGDKIAAIMGSAPAACRVHPAVAVGLTPDLRRRIAHHEASHAVTAVTLGAEVAWVAVTMRPDEVARAGLPALPAGHQYGCTMVRCVDPHTDAVVSLAGWVADLGHIFGPRHTHDTQQAYELVGIAGFPAALRDAQKILADRRADVQAVREELIRYDRITGDQLAALVRR